MKYLILIALMVTGCNDSLLGNTDNKGQILGMVTDGNLTTIPYIIKASAEIQIQGWENKSVIHRMEIVAISGGDTVYSNSVYDFEFKDHEMKRDIKIHSSKMNKDVLLYFIKKNDFNASVSYWGEYVIRSNGTIEVDSKALDRFIQLGR